MFCPRRAPLDPAGAPASPTFSHPQRQSRAAGLVLRRKGAHYDRINSASRARSGEDFSRPDCSPYLPDCVNVAYRCASPCLKRSLIPQTAR